MSAPSEEVATNKDGATTPAQPAASAIQIPWDILIAFLSIFQFSSNWDKFLLLIGTIFTLINAMAFLVFSFLLGFITQPIILQTNFGFGNKAANYTQDIIKNANGTKLLTKSELERLITEVSICYGVIGFVILISTFIQTLCWEWTAETQSCRLREKLAVQILRQELSWFENQTVGELGYKLINDVERIREGIGHKFSMILKHAVICTVLVISGLIINWQLTLLFLTLAPLPLVIARVLYYGKMLAEKTAKEKELYAKANEIATEVVTNIRSIASFSREDLEIDRYRATIMKAVSFALGMYKSHAMGVSVFFMLLYGSYAYAFHEGCKRLLDHTIIPQDLYKIFCGATMVIFSVSHILPWMATVSTAYGCKMILANVFESIPTIDVQNKNSKIIRHLRGKLSFEKVSFAYSAHKDKNIIDGFNLEIQGNPIVGIISGEETEKTTLVNLLLRFYDPTVGEVKIDDLNIKLLSVGWLRHHISVVPRLPLFRQETILTNILAGCGPTSFEQVVEAAKLAHADDFIRSLPQGYATIIGATGTELSRHEKQKISLTRALVRKPFWLIFDDSLKDLPDHQGIVQKIRQSRRGGATIIFTHNSDVIKHVDVIHVVKSGKIVESGTMDELLLKNGIFSEMIKQEAKIPKHYYIMAEDDPDPSKDIFLPTSLPDETTGQSYKYKGLWKMLKLVNRDMKDWNRWIFGTIGCILTGLILPIFVLLCVDVFATFGESEDKLEVDYKSWTLFLAGVALVNGVGYYLRAYYISIAGEYTGLNLRLFTLMSIVRRPISWFDKPENNPSTLCSRLTSEVPYIKVALDNRFAMALSGTVSTSTAIIIALAYCWQLGLIVLASVPIFSILVYIQFIVQRKNQIIGVNIMDYANALFTQAIQCIWTIQAFGQEHEICQDFNSKVKSDLRQRHNQCITFAIVYAISESLMYFLFGAIFFYGGNLIGQNVLEPVILFRVFLVVSFSLIAVGPTNVYITDFIKAEISFDRTLSLIEGEEKFILHPKQEGISPWIDGNITFDKVAFCYPNRSDRVLDGCTFSISAGLMLGLTGAFGAGKSTTLALIQRLYDLNDGRILIDGDNIQDINLGHLRTNIGHIPTEPTLFDCTLEENISYGYCGEVEGPGLRVLVQEAAEFVDLKKLLQRYPDGYSTQVQSDGAGLSTLEKRKIGFARAIIRTPRLVLIDEPMIGLNTEDELEMMDLINKIRVGRTCIVTTARLELLKEADVVAVLQSGKVTEFGNQEELSVRKNGFYSLLLTQAGLSPIRKDNSVSTKVSGLPDESKLSINSGPDSSSNLVKDHVSSVIPVTSASSSLPSGDHVPSPSTASSPVAVHVSTTSSPGGT